ncbi:MAG TPA: MFS transporter, partial [Ktedonobacterales bacterium]|nr:MFS transporter [Ktedonobacterales bacterium]
MAESSSLPIETGVEANIPHAPERKLPAALQAPTRAVGIGFTTMICLANVALWLSMQPVAQILLPLQAEALGGSAHKADNLGIILGVGAFVSIFSNAIAGALSDRTTSRFGRRRPWLLLCSLLTAATLALLANAPAVYVLVIGWGVYQLFANGVLAALVAIVPDRVPEAQRGSVSA